MKDKPIITVEAVKLLIGDIWRQKTDSRFPQKIMIEICEAIDTMQDAPEAGKYIKYYPNKNNPNIKNK